MFGLSPLSTAHPSIFQHTTVRSSTRFYSRFNLAMDRSPGFGSTPRNYIALLRLAFATATPNGLTLLYKVTRRLIMQKVRGHTCLRRSGNIVLPLIVGLRFHILFHSPHRGAFHLSLTVLVHYRSSTVFSLRRWSSQIPARFLVSRSTRVSDPG